MALPAAAYAQAGPRTTPPNGVTGYALVYEDNFATDPANADGGLQNVYISATATPRAQWYYRTGNNHGCNDLSSSSQVFLSPSMTGGSVPGLRLRDTASAPSSTNAAFTSGPNEAYQTYNCGAMLTVPRFGFGYYESYAALNVSTAIAGFHTSFWTTGPFNPDEVDIFENESSDNTDSGIGFYPGFFAHTNTSSLPIPNPHTNTPWSALPNGGYKVAHAFGSLMTPKGQQFYNDGNAIAGSVTLPGPFVASEIELSSVGSVYTSPHKADHTSGPWIQYDGSSPSLDFDYSFQYVKYYQPTAANLVRPQALPPGSIFIDTSVPISYTSSTFTPGNFKPYLTYPYAGATNPNLVIGPQGFRTQNAYTSNVPGDTASWAHTFTSADAGSYDVYIWNATEGVYQIPPTSNNDFATDSASRTQYQVTGSTGTTPLSQVISQAASGQSWVALNSTSQPSTNLTNTYAFAAGSTAIITLTVGTETSEKSTKGTAFTPHTDADSVAFVPVYTSGTTDGAIYSDSGFNGSSLPGWAGSTASRYSSMGGDASAHATWNAPLPAAGTYTLYAYTPGDSNTTTYAKYTVSDGATILGTAHLDQAAQDNYWVPIGTYTWTGTTATVSVQNGDGSSHPANGFLRTNAIKFVAQLPENYYVCTSSTGFYGASLYSTSGNWTTGSNGYSGCAGIDQVASGSGASATFLPQVPVAGFYHAYLYNDPALATSTNVVVQSHAKYPATCNGITTAGSTQWIYLGDYYFGPESYPQGGQGSPMINDSITLTSTGGSIGASAMYFRYSGSVGTATPCVNN